MPTYSALLLAAAGLVAADGLTAMNLGEASGRGVTLAGLGSAAFGVYAAACAIGETTCDISCMPLTGVCCGLGNGAYCDIGYSCISDGCCPVGKVCSGAPTGCEGDRDLCGEFCVPKGTCSSGGGGGGGGGGDGGCPTGYVACDSECMPAGSVCCHNGYHCDAGQTCTADFECQLGGSGGGGGSGGSSGDGGNSQTSTSIRDIFTSDGGDGFPGSSTTYKLSPDPEPTPTPTPTQSNPFGGSGGGDDTTTTSDPFPAFTTGADQSSTPDNSPPITSDAGQSTTTAARTRSTTTSSGGKSSTISSLGLLAGLLAVVPFIL